MKIGGLFSGIGGLELGLERAGVGHTVWQVESDPFCRQVLARHWPDATRYEDVTTVDWLTVEPVEVMCGGFPCQDLSYAGKGAGLAGDRSGLWREYVRAIRGVRPRFVVVENVPALLARGMGDVLGDLAACGYDAEWDCVPAAAVGAPHRRDRLFVVAYPNGKGEPGVAVDALTRPGFVVSGTARRRMVGDSNGNGEPRTVAQPREVQRTVRPSGGDGDPWATEPDVGRVVDGLSDRMDELRALGNAVVPQVAEVVGRRVMELAA